MATDPLLKLDNQLCFALYAASNAMTRRYRDRLAESDLADPKLIGESRTALDELTRILQLGNVYPFQRE